MIKSKVWVELLISEFEISPDELTKIIGVEPTKTSKKGDIFLTPKGKEIIEPFNEWSIESGCPTSEHFEEQMTALISKLKPFKNEFLEFCKKYSPFFNIVIHVFKGESYPHIGIQDQEIIKNMAMLNARFGIDYSFFEDEKDL